MRFFSTVTGVALASLVAAGVLMVATMPLRDGQLTAQVGPACNGSLPPCPNGGSWYCPPPRTPACMGGFVRCTGPGIGQAPTPVCQGGTASSASSAGGGGGGSSVAGNSSSGGGSVGGGSSGGGGVGGGGNVCDASASAITRYDSLMSLGVHIAPTPGGSLWFLGNTNANAVGRIFTGGQVTQFPLPVPGTNPAGIASDANGNAWVTSAGLHAILRITPAGQITQFAIPTTVANPSYPNGIVVDLVDGNVWYTQAGTNKVGKMTPAGVVTEYAVPTPNAGLGAMTVGPDGAIWFLERQASKIGRITTTGQITEFPVTSPPNTLFAIVAGPDSALWFTEMSPSNRIGRLGLGGGAMYYPAPVYQAPGASAGVVGIAYGPDGNLWFTEGSVGRIGRITTAGVIHEYQLIPGGVTPTGIASGPDGKMWYLETAANKIGTFIAGDLCAGSSSSGGNSSGGGSSGGGGNSSSGSNQCPFVCGDDIVVAGEECDDGNTTDGDGCSAQCEVESGSSSSGQQSSGTQSSGGSSSTGQSSSGGSSSTGQSSSGGSSSTRNPQCGDGRTDAPEECDDGNTQNGDCCSAQCGIESGCACSLGPTGGGGGACIQPYEYTMAVASTARRNAAGQYQGTAVVCPAMPSGWTRIDEECVLMVGNACVSTYCLYRKPTTQNLQYTITHEGTSYGSAAVDCSRNVPQGFVLKERGCAASDDGTPRKCLSDLCFWEKTGTSSELLLSYAAGDCRSSNPTGDNNANVTRTCLFGASNCLCLWSAACQSSGGTGSSTPGVGGGGSSAAQSSAGLCTETDGGNAILLAGSTTGPVGGVQTVLYDYCVLENQTDTDPRIREALCGGNIPTQWTSTCPVPRRCVNGSCADVGQAAYLEQMCQDTDGSMNPWTQGTVFAGSGEFGQDFCDPNSPTVLNEYVCNNARGVLLQFTCQNGTCQNGACVTSAASSSTPYCIDVDGESLTAQSQGRVGGQYGYVDSCMGADVREFVCATSAQGLLSAGCLGQECYGYKRIPCPGGRSCINGGCP